MTRAFWDSQFRFSQVLPDFADYLARAEQDSAAWAAGKTLRRHAYGPDHRQWAEVTPGTGPQTCMPVLIHGGYWRALRAEDHRFLLPALVPFGDVVANVEYRLMPGVRIAEVVSDVQAALAGLARLFPRARLVLVGHSAGAHLALSALADPALQRRTAGVIALGGVYDLHPVRLCFLQDELNLSAAEAAAYSLHPSDARGPVVYVNGSAETHEFLRGSALMASAGPSALHHVPGANHMSLLWAARDAMPDLFATLTSLQPAS